MIEIFFNETYLYPFSGSKTSCNSQYWSSDKYCQMRGQYCKKNVSAKPLEDDYHNLGLGKELCTDSQSKSLYLFIYLFIYLFCFNHIYSKQNITYNTNISN